MKGYGLPRRLDLDGYPDVADSHLYGVKTSLNRNPSRNGRDRKGLSPKLKTPSRRIWKKKARKEHQKDTDQRLQDYLWQEAEVYFNA